MSTPSHPLTNTCSCLTFLSLFSAPAVISSVRYPNIVIMHINHGHRAILETGCQAVLPLVRWTVAAVGGAFLLQLLCSTIKHATDTWGKRKKSVLWHFWKMATTLPPIQWRQSRLPLPELTQRWSWALIPVNCARHVQDWFPSSGEWRNWRSGQTEGESTSGPCIWAGISYCGSSPRRHKFQVFSLSPQLRLFTHRKRALMTVIAWERWWWSSPVRRPRARVFVFARLRVSANTRSQQIANRKKLTFVLFFLKWWSI